MQTKLNKPEQNIIDHLTTMSNRQDGLFSAYAPDGGLYQTVTITAYDTRMSGFYARMDHQTVSIVKIESLTNHLPKNKAIQDGLNGLIKKGYVINTHGRTYLTLIGQSAVFGTSIHDAAIQRLTDEHTSTIAKYAIALQAIRRLRTMAIANGDLIHHWQWALSVYRPDMSVDHPVYAYNQRIAKAIENDNGMEWARKDKIERERDNAIRCQERAENIAEAIERLTLNPERYTDYC